MIILVNIFSNFSLHYIKFNICIFTIELYSPFMTSIVLKKIFLISNVRIISTYIRTVSMIWVQLQFFSMPYFGCQGQCLGMKCPHNLHKQVAFKTVVQRSTVNSLMRSKLSLTKHWTKHTTSRRFLCVKFVSDHGLMISMVWKQTKYLVFDAFREEYLWSLKTLLFLSICRLFHLVIP